MAFPFDAARWPDALVPYIHADPAAPVHLKRMDPGAQICSVGNKALDKQAVESLALELDALQNLFYADRRHRLLVVLQGLDTSGKDGTLRSVFGRMSPLGVRVAAWKAPTEPERAHDFLWRIHAAVPADGEITIFNRSHYEDVLVPHVNGTLHADALQRRLVHINDFERMLAETGTVVLKFMLHISKDEQRKRLQARLDEPDKRWKFDPTDLKVRAQWDAYQATYQAMLQATGTPWAPWIVVPADSKTHRNLVIGMALRAVLQAMELRLPPEPPELHGLEVT